LNDCTLKALGTNPSHGESYKYGVHYGTDSRSVLLKCRDPNRSSIGDCTFAMSKAAAAAVIHPHKKTHR